MTEVHLFPFWRPVSETGSLGFPLWGAPLPGRRTPSSWARTGEGQALEPLIKDLISLPSPLGDSQSPPALDSRLPRPVLGRGGHTLTPFAKLSIAGRVCRENRLQIRRGAAEKEPIFPVLTLGHRGRRRRRRRGSQLVAGAQAGKNYTCLSNSRWLGQKDELAAPGSGLQGQPPRGTTCPNITCALLKATHSASAYSLHFGS